MFGMKHVDSESPSDVARWLRNESADLGPAVLGSLSLRGSRCIRENCRACLSGEQHQSFVLYGRANGRRVAVYVPEELVAEVQRSLDNGRALQEMVHQERRGLSGCSDSGAAGQFCRLGAGASGLAP